MNPTALVFWTFIALGGWLMFHTVDAAVIGALIGIGISLTAEFVSRIR